jgi:hypothetical protein
LLVLVPRREAVPSQPDPLATWNDGPAKQAITDFVHATTTPGDPKFVSPAERIATFDQDGTLWAEHPMYTQVVYCLDRVPAIVAEKPKLRNIEPFKTVLSGNRAAMAKLTMRDLEKILELTLSGMTVDAFREDVATWLATARDPRWRRPYTDLVYEPMLQVMRLLRASGYKTSIVTGGGQDFVRVYSEKVYGVPPEQVVGTAGATRYALDKAGQPTLTKEPKLLLNDDRAGKPEGIHLMIGRRPRAAFGNSAGDPRDARIRDDRRRRPSRHAGNARRCDARIRLRAGARLARDQGRHFHRGALQRSPQARLGRHQHEKRLEAHRCVR